MMKPTMNRLLVKIIKDEVKEGEAPKGNAIMNGKVLAIGPDVEGFFQDAEVIFAPYGFDEVVSLPDDKQIIISKDLILAVK